MGRKRKQSRGAAGRTSQKRRALEPEAAHQTATEGRCLNSDEDAPPEVDDIIKVELELESGPEDNINQEELFEESGIPNLASDPDIDIGEVLLMRTPKVELMGEDEDDGNVTSSITSLIYGPVTPNIDIESCTGGNGQTSPSTSKLLEEMVSPTECENSTAAAAGDGNIEATSQFSSDPNGNPLVIEMTGKRNGAAREDDADVDDATTATTITIGGQNLTEEIIVRKGEQEMMPHDGSAKNHVSRIHTAIAVNMEERENSDNLLSVIQEKDEEIARLTETLKAATGQTEFLQQEVNSESFRNQELSSKIKLLEEEAKKLVQENSRTVEKLQRELKRTTSLYNNTVSEKDKKIKSQAGEIKGINDELERLDSENDRLNNLVTPKQAVDNKRLQKDNANLRRVITEKDKVIQKCTVKIEGLQKDLKILEEDSKGRMAELNEARNLADQNSRMAKEQQEEANRNIDLLKNSISEKDNELAQFKARHFRDDQGNSQLHLAAKKGDEPAVKELVELGADVNARNNNSETPILLAVTAHVNSEAALKTVKHLVQHGGDVNAADYHWQTPILLAAAGRVDANATLRMVKYLIEQGANVDAQDMGDETFLHRLLRISDTELDRAQFEDFEAFLNPTQFHDMVTFLISKDLSRLFNTHDGCYEITPFQDAMSAYEIERATLSLLKNNGVDFNAVDDMGWSVLYLAIVKNSSLEMTSDLVDLGADPNHLTNDKQSMLHAAAIECNVELIQFFLDKGLDVNAQDKDGDTPLHWAIASPSEENTFETVQFLLENGARTDIVNVIGKSPRDYFIDNRDRYPDAEQIAACFSLVSSY